MSKPPETTCFSRWRRRPATWGFANAAQATCVNSPVIEAGGLRTKERVSLKTGVFGAMEPSKVACRALWDKTRTQRPEFKVCFRSCPSFCPRSRRNTTRRYLAALDSRRRRKLGATGMTGRQNRRHRAEKRTSVRCNSVMRDSGHGFIRIRARCCIWGDVGDQRPRRHCLRFSFRCPKRVAWGSSPEEN